MASLITRQPWYSKGRIAVIAFLLLQVAIVGVIIVDPDPQSDDFVDCSYAHASGGKDSAPEPTPAAPTTGTLSLNLRTNTASVIQVRLERSVQPCLVHAFATLVAQRFFATLHCVPIAQGSPGLHCKNTGGGRVPRYGVTVAPGRTSVPRYPLFAFPHNANEAFKGDFYLLPRAGVLGAKTTVAAGSITAVNDVQLYSFPLEIQAVGLLSQ